MPSSVAEVIEIKERQTDEDTSRALCFRYSALVYGFAIPVPYRQVNP